MNKNNGKVYGSAILFSTIVGFSFIGVKLCVEYANTFELLAYRFNFALLAAVLMLIFKLTNIDLKNKTKKNLVITAGFYLIFMILQTIGLFFVTSIISGIVFSLVPILTKLFAEVILKEKSTWQQNGFVVLSIISLIIMIVMGADTVDGNLLGIVILTLSSLAMAVSNVFMRFVRSDYTPFEIAFSIAALGCIAFNLMSFSYGSVTMGISEYIKNYFALMVNLRFIIPIIYLGALSTLISSLIMSYMLANMQAMKATMFGNVSTAISIVAGVIVLGEQLEIYHVVCCMLIVVCVVGVFLPYKSKHALEEKGDKVC